MITSWQMYWLTRLDAIDYLFYAVAGLAAVSAITLAITGAIIRCDYRYEDAGWKTGKRLHVKWVPICLATSAVAALACVLTPSTRQMAAIIVVPKVVNNEKVHTVGNKLYDLAVEWMTTLRPNKTTQKD